VLDILERNRVHATFFLIGQQVRGNESLVRRELADGNAVGNHTFTHANVSGGGLRQLTSTQGAIRRASGYTPCVFRAPYGAVSGTIIGQARGLGLDTIEWDVDPRDWARPGTDAIYSRLVGGARRESILLMHDGGGPRDQTVAALPRVIATLRARGYGFVTVPELLGLRPQYS
jgi:peptidoglycan/xylan/chitin deacetylase (PgdA/CDA1 family)